jgi:hypothetical protein
MPLEAPVMKTSGPLGEEDAVLFISAPCGP